MEAVVCAPKRSSIADPPPPELLDDPFDRQRVMVNWDNEPVHKATALVLGVGGLGSSVAMALCRLGVQKLLLLDCDNVEVTNLNRQILFCKADVGKPKVEAGKAGLAIHNVRDTVIETIHTDAITDWGRVVELCRQSTVVFNCIDYGSLFDYAVNVITKCLQIPYILGSSYANTSVVNYFTGKPGKACWTCFNAVEESFTANQNQSEDIDKWLAERRGAPVTGEAKDIVLSETELVDFHRDQMSMHNTQDIVHEALATAGTPNGVTKSDYAAWVRKHFQPSVLKRLEPEHLFNYKSIQFVPKDLHYPTRYVGSWVCVCTGSALMMVNAWAQGINNNGDFPNYCNFTLNTFDASSSTKEGADPGTDKFCRVCPACDAYINRQQAS
eukprot:TRINITY_DN2051_c0_g1_i1.p1 TRINITY_DN2051_c0_g1~~TRINITY_DN2051_c0_g1_i1.p1  ORF type:complete len:384 (-),score=57.22 TRINITY_DN2051_c0_g1_i1:49-1200(-)